MEESVLHHVLYRLANARVHSYPYPHFYVNDIFPEDFYQELIEYLPDTSYFKSLSESGLVHPETYKQRYIFSLEENALSQLPFSHFMFWSKFTEALHSQLWQSMLLENFDSYIRQRFGAQYDTLKFSSIAQLIRDRTDYSIGPHTDHPIRVMTLLFYFPYSKEQMDYGTSIYRPRTPNFECEGFDHHPFQHFVKVRTLPFLPNSVFGFFRSNRSFHGVEPIKEEGVERNLMNYYLQWKQT